METKIVYFEKQGEKYTDQTLALAKKRADELGIKTIVVSSTRGNTAVKAVDVFKGSKVIIVTHAYGHREPNLNDFTEENRKLVESKKGIILTTTEAFGGIQSSLRSGMPTHDINVQAGDSQSPQPPPSHTPPPKTGTGDIIAATLRMFNLGMKVVCEIAPMAVDAGLVRTDEEIICIAGSHNGADTAVVMKSASVNRFFDSKIREIICKPRNSDF